jgi:hypothetical protein
VGKATFRTENAILAIMLQVEAAMRTCISALIEADRDANRNRSAAQPATGDA